jgi:hypothetical protein
MTAETYAYESSAKIVFSFKEVGEGENKVSMDNYYTITGLKLGTTDNKVTIENVGGTYKVTSDTDSYGISEKDGTFTVTIKNVNKSTAGEYDISYTKKQFTVNVTTKLYDSNGDLVANTEPGDIYFLGGNTAQKLPLALSVSYGSSKSLETKLRNSSSAYSFEGWYMEGKTDSLSTSTSYTIDFGTGDFTIDDITIYAKYQNDACRITFDIQGDGISEIKIGGNDVSNNVATVAKTQNSLILDIYVKNGYDFDVKRFVDKISIYKGENDTYLCTWTNEDNVTDNHYTFNLDMTVLKGENIDSFSVEVVTSKSENSNNNLIWYIVGGVGGALLLGVVIFLIVFFAKRRNGGMGGNYGKKSFNGNYY